MQSLWDPVNLLEAVKAVYTLVFLAVFSLQDYRSREISDRLVYLFTGGSAVFLAATLMLHGFDPVYMVFSAVVPLTFTLLYYAGLMGEGDVYVAASLFMLYPSPPRAGFLPRSLLPPLIPIVLYSTVSVVLISLLYASYTVIVHRNLLKGMPLKYRLIYPFIARPMKVADFIETRFYYPLTLIEAGDRETVTVYRLHYSVEEDPGVYRELFRKLVDAGTISADTVIWVSYGVPYIIPLTIGVAAFLIIGDAPVLALIKHIAGLAS